MTERNPHLSLVKEVAYFLSPEAALLARYLPKWGSQAACAAGPRSSGAVHSNTSHPWAPMFKDEVTTRKSDVEYRWPADVLRAMKVCAGCPVRRTCLAYAYDNEKHIVDESGGGVEAHSGEESLHSEWEEDDRRFGVYGMLPGAMRERFADEPNRLELAEQWAQSFAEARGWLVREANGQEGVA